MIKFLNEAKKFVAAVTGVAGILVSTGLLNGRVEFYVNLAIGAVTSVLVYLLSNADPTPAVGEHEAQ